MDTLESGTYSGPANRVASLLDSDMDVGPANLLSAENRRFTEDIGRFTVSIITLENLESNFIPPSYWIKQKPNSTEVSVICVDPSKEFKAQKIPILIPVERVRWYMGEMKYGSTRESSSYSCAVCDTLESENEPLYECSQCVYFHKSCFTELSSALKKYVESHQTEILAEHI